MKMRILDRILLTILSLFNILLSFVLLAEALNLVSLDLLSDAIFGWPQIILIAAAVILFLSAFVC
jgi:hypothetical protein